MCGIYLARAPFRIHYKLVVVLQMETHYQRLLSSRLPPFNCTDAGRLRSDGRKSVTGT